MAPSLTTISGFNEIFGSGNLFSFSSTGKYWTQFGYSFGIAIQAFDPPPQWSEYCLRLSLGDLVIIKGEYEGWYKGERFPSTTATHHQTNISPKDSHPSSTTISGSHMSVNKSSRSHSMVPPLTTQSEASSSTDSLPTTNKTLSSSGSTNVKTNHRKTDADAVPPSSNNSLNSKGFFPSSHIVRFDGSPNNPFSLNYSLSTGEQTNSVVPPSSQNNQTSNTKEGNENKQQTVYSIPPIYPANYYTSSNSSINMFSPRGEDSTGSRFSSIIAPQTAEESVTQRLSSSPPSATTPFPTKQSQHDQTSQLTSAIHNTSNSNTSSTFSSVNNTPLVVSSIDFSSTTQNANTQMQRSNLVSFSGEYTENSVTVGSLESNSSHVTSLYQPITNVLSTSPSTLGTLATGLDADPIRNTSSKTLNGSKRNSSEVVQQDSLTVGFPMVASISSPSLSILSSSPTNSGQISPTLSKEPSTHTRSKSFRRGILNSFQATKLKLEGLMNKEKTDATYNPVINNAINGSITERDRRPMTPDNSEKMFKRSQSNELGSQKPKRASLNLSGLNIFGSRPEDQQDVLNATMPISSPSHRTEGSDEKLFSPSNNLSHRDSFKSHNDKKRSHSVVSSAFPGASPRSPHSVIVNSAVIALGNVFPELIYSQPSTLGGVVDIFSNMSGHYQREIAPFSEENWFSPFLQVPFCRSMIETVFEWNINHFESLATQEDNRERFIRVFEIECKMLNYMIDYYSYQKCDEEGKNFKTRMTDILKMQVYLLEEGSSLFSEDIVIKKNGEKLTPANTQIYDLYMMYWESIDQEKKSKDGSSKKKNSLLYRMPEGNSQLLIEITGCGYYERVEWRFGLYDIGTKKFISEDLIVSTNRRNISRISVASPEDFDDEGTLDEDEDPTIVRNRTNSTISALFKDIPKGLFEKEQLVLLLRVFKFERISDNSNMGHNLDCRVPFAIGCTARFNQTVVSDLANGGNIRQEVFFYAFKNTQPLVNTVQDIMNDEMELERTDLFGVEMVMSMISGDYYKAMKQSPQIAQMPIVPMTHFSSSVLPDDIRNDIYITLDNLLLKTMRTLFVEAKMYIKDKDGNTVQCDINRKQRVYRSATVRMKSLAWNETILVNVNSHQLQSAIVVFDFYVVSQKKNGVGVAPEFFAFWPIESGTQKLCNSFGMETTLEPISCYKYSKSFTNIHDFFSNEALQSKLEKSAKLTMSVNVVSTSISLNPKLRDFLNWHNMDERSLSVALRELNLKTIDTITCFREIMSCLLGISQKYGKYDRESIEFVDSPLLQLVFEKICAILYPLTDQYERCMAIIDEYRKSLQYHLTHRFILFYLNKFCDYFELEELSMETKDKLVRVLKCINYLMKLVLTSLKNFKVKLSKVADEETRFVQNELTMINVKLTHLAKKTDSEKSPFKTLKATFFDTMTTDFFDVCLEIFTEKRFSKQLAKYLSALPDEDVQRKLNLIESIVRSKGFESGEIRGNLLPSIVEFMEGYSECFLDKKTISIVNKMIQTLKSQCDMENRSRVSISDDSSGVDSDMLSQVEDLDEVIPIPLVHIGKSIESVCELLGLIGLLKGAFETSLMRTEELEAEYAAVRERIEQEETNTASPINEQTKRKNLLLTIKHESDINNSKRVSCDIILTIINLFDLFTYKDILSNVLSKLEESAQCAEMETIEQFTDLIGIILSKKNALPKNWIQMNIYQYGRVTDVILLCCLRMKKYLSLLEGSSITKISSFSLALPPNQDINRLLKTSFTNKLLGDYNIPRIIRIWQQLVRQLFDAIFSFEPEKMPSYDRKQFLNNNDARSNTIYYFYETIWTNAPFQLQETFVPEMIDKIIKLFKLGLHHVTIVAKNLFYDMLKIEYKSRRSLSLSEAATERCFIEIAGFDERIKQTFISALEAKLNSYNDVRLLSTVEEDFPKHVQLFIEALHHLMAQINEIEKANNNDPNTMTFQSQEKSFKNALKSFKKNNNMQLYYKYLHLLANMQKSRKRFVEAGLAIMKHASKLDLNSKTILPFFSDRYPEESECKRKANLYHEIIELFEKGKDWERAIALNEELREYYKKNMQYSELSQLHSEEGKLYKKIVTNIREYNKYYLVGFYGKSLANMNYIFNAHHQKLADFVNFIKLKFKGAIIKREIPSAFDESKFKTSEQQIIFLTPLEPSSTEEMNAFVENKTDSFGLLDPSVSPKISEYYRSHNINVFKRIKVKKEEKLKIATPTMEESKPVIEQPRAINLEDSEGTINFFTVKNAFPNIYTIQQITDRKHLKLNTLQVAIYYLGQRIEMLQELVISHKLNEPNLLTASLDSELTGLIDPRIHGGIYQDVEKYLSPDAIASVSEENTNLVDMYKTRLATLAQLLKEGLVQRRKHVSKQNLQMSVYLEKKFKTDLIPLLQKYNITLQ